MKNLFDSAAVLEVKARVGKLTPASERKWGTMTAAQALAHCAGSLEMALGEFKPPRALIGRIIGGAIKRLALGNDEPMRRNTPTVKGLAMKDTRVLDAERNRLTLLIDRFAAGGPAACSQHPHSFFGRLTPEEWAVLMYKHLDHHLRQFDA